MQESLNVAGMPQNDATPKEIRTRSTFPLSYHLFATHRFAEYAPHYVFDGVAGDKVPINSSQRVDSYSLNAPLMQDISIKKDYYEVPMEAIIPKNWDKWFTNPVVGDDCPDDCGTGVAEFWKSVANSGVVSSIRTILAGTASQAIKFTAFIRFAVYLEYFYSAGSLLTSLGCHGNAFCRIVGKNAYATKESDFDAWFDQVFNYLVNGLNGLETIEFRTSDGVSRYVGIGSSPNAVTLRSLYPTVSLRDMLNYFRDDLNSVIVSVTCVGTGTINALLDPFVDTANYSFYLNAASGVDYDTRRLWAYQLVCAHFYSNDHIDYIYSAELYRELIHYYLREISSTPETFSMNGLTFEYDYLSGHNFKRLLGLVSSNSTAFLDATTSPLVTGLRGYFSSVMSFRRSLRFMDYFTGSRSRPLAVGDVNVDVQTGTPNYISVIDNTQKTQKQKFLNAVNRVGRKFEEYLKGVMNVDPAVDYHNPLYLAHTKDSVFAREVENTGVAQQTQGNSVTSRLSSSGGRYTFEFSLDRPAVVLGITYFDIERVYIYSCERQLFHMNRFDDFNPYMQFIGDQPVYRHEVGSNRPLTAGTFAYQLRHMEYKQRYSQAVGGFVHALPGYIFANDADQGRYVSNIGPDYIRCLSSELDSFYVSLTGWSLGTYFHFIVDHFNGCDASRPMAYAPSIL